MKILIAYSSRTGNTKKIAEALYEVAPEGTVLAKVEDKPMANEFDVVFVGYWVDRGAPDGKSKEFLRTLKNKKVILFETLGADPASSHAYTVFANAGIYLAEGNHVVAVLAIQGAVDPALIAMMRKMPAGSPHNSAQMEATVKEAAKHPDEADIEKAKAFMKMCVVRFR